MPVDTSGTTQFPSSSSVEAKIKILLLTRLVSGYGLATPLESHIMTLQKLRSAGIRREGK